MMNTNNTVSRFFFSLLVLSFAQLGGQAIAANKLDSREGSSQQSIGAQQELSGPKDKVIQQASPAQGAIFVDSLSPELCRENFDSVHAQPVGSLQNNQFENCTGTTGGTTGGCTCPTPSSATNVGISNVIETGVDLTWSAAPNPKTGYQIRFKRSPSNAVVGTTTSVGAAAVMASLAYPSALQPSDMAFLEIRTVNACGGGCSARYSGWVPSTVFMVPAAQDDVPPVFNSFTPSVSFEAASAGSLSLAQVVSAPTAVAATDAVDGSCVLNGTDCVLAASGFSAIPLNALGSTAVNFSATDSSGNSASATRTVVVQDTTDPVLTVTDLSYPTPPGGTFGPAEALNQIVASDNLSAPANITIATSYEGNMSYALDLSASGVSYVITVSATDQAGNSANDTFTVSIAADTSQPSISITGGTLIFAAAAGEEATEAEVFALGGFTAVDQPGNVPCVLDGSTGCTLDIQGTPINLSQPGSSQITYVATDMAGNTTTQNRNVDIQDQAAPTIFYDANGNGTLDAGEDNPQAPAVSLQVGSSYSQAQALMNVLAVDDIDQDVQITVDVSTPGYDFPLNPADSVTVSIVYTPTDDAGLTDSMSRQISFQAPTSEPVLLFINPIADQVGVGTQPVFQWEVGLPSSYNPADYTFTYNFRISFGDSCSSPYLFNLEDQNNLPSNSYDLQDGENLVPDGRQYTWCVQVLNNGVEFLPFTSASFHTQEIVIPTPSIAISPPSSQSSQSGEQNFVISGQGGESAPSEAVIYRVTNGNIDSLPLASIPMNPNGTFNYETGVLDIDSDDDYSFVAQVKRGSDQFGEFSNIATHYYDPALSIPAPFLTNVVENAEIFIDINTSEPFDSIKVWRRVALELCASGECYQGMKPFKKIGDTSESLQNFTAVDGDTWKFEDAEFTSNPALGGDDGVSYFATLHAGNRSSQRSNSVSKGDLKAISVIEEDMSTLWAIPRLVFYGPPEGDRIETYLCDVDSYLQDNGAPQPYGIDNSADLKIDVYYALKNPEQSCDQFDVDDLQNFESGQFDSLSRVSVPQAGINTPSCVLAHTRLVPAPGLSYCHSVCISDKSQVGGGDGFSANVKCLEGVSVEGDASDDLVQPDFDGIDELYAGDDGRSLLAKWNPAEGSSDAEVILYELQYTSSFLPNGNPNFADAVSKNVDPDTLQHTIENLDSDKKYAVRVLAIDDDISGDAQGQVPGATKVKSKKTLNNFPVVRDLQISQTAGRGGYANLSFNLYDRNVAFFGETHVLRSVKIRPASQAELQAVNGLQDRTVTKGLGALSAASTPGDQVQENNFTFNFTDVLTPGDLDKPMYIEVEVEDTAGLVGVGQAIVVMNEQSSGNSQRIGGAGLSCGMIHQSAERPWSPWFLLFGLIALYALLRRPNWQ